MKHREKKTPPVEKKIGGKIHTLRKGRGMSQIELAEKIGLSFQQIQKYEKGMTKVSVHRLQQIADALGVSITFFFDPENPKHVSSPKPSYGDMETAQPSVNFLDKEDITFLKLFRKIKNKKIKQGLIKQLRGIAELEKDNGK